MAIKQTAISYYGLNYVEHAEQDFKEMIDHGCTTVILAITEFDMDFWFPSINKIVNKAKELGLKVVLDPWGIGKFFGGEQVSLFLQNNIQNRQVSALTGEALPFACFNTNSFRDYFQDLSEACSETDADASFGMNHTMHCLNPMLLSQEVQGKTGPADALSAKRSSLITMAMKCLR